MIRKINCSLELHQINGQPPQKMRTISCKKAADYNRMTEKGDNPTKKRKTKDQNSKLKTRVKKCI